MRVTSTVAPLSPLDRIRKMSGIPINLVTINEANTSDQFKAKSKLANLASFAALRQYPKFIPLPGVGRPNLVH